MKFLTVVAALAATAAAIEFREGEDCGNYYGWETCNFNNQNPNTAVIVCNDRHVWAQRQYCGGGSIHEESHCCQLKSGGGAHCVC